MQDQQTKPEPRPKRDVSDEMIIKYKPMVESFLKKSVIKNWNEAVMSKTHDEVGLGNSGQTMADIRAYLTSEVFIALRNYNPDYKAKESTFVYGHLSKRVGSLMKKLTNKSKGYGVWTSNLEEVLGEIDKVE
jgi:hypothetical protein